MQKHTLLQGRSLSVILRASRGSEQQHNHTEETQRKSKIKLSDGCMHACTVKISGA